MAGPLLRSSSRWRAKSSRWARVASGRSSPRASEHRSDAFRTRQHSLSGFPTGAHPTHIWMFGKHLVKTPDLSDHRYLWCFSKRNDAGSTAAHAEVGKLKGFGMDQGLELSLWLGTAGLALSSAHLFLWRTRRVLNRPRRDVESLEAAPSPDVLRQEIRPAPAVTQQEVRHPSGALQKSA